MSNKTSRIIYMPLKVVLTTGVRSEGSSGFFKPSYKLMQLSKLNELSEVSELIELIELIESIE